MRPCIFLLMHSIVITLISFCVAHPQPVCAQAAPAALAPNTLTPAEIAEGWIALFDGQTLFGWRPTSKADWSVAEGEIRVEGGEKGLLRTTSQFSDFHLSVDFKTAANTNSGVFVRTSPNPRNLLRDCFEINIAPADNGFPTGAVVGVQKATEQPNVDHDHWNSMEVVVRGQQVTVKVNQTVVNQVTATEQGPGRGFVGLQFNRGAIRFRNVFLKPLGLKPLLNGKDLQGWDDSQKRASTFSVDPQGRLKVLSGRGQLESKKLLADFVLQASCKTNAVGLNSGIFFRSIPGDFTNGYESQIQNQFVDGDPEKPADCGTGGIFRRQNARRVNARDKEWFTKTIVATGRHMAVWVNGLQVTDWTDKRAADPNPRRGLRLEAGSIILQGHDPTTDILFGRIDAAELTPRH